MSTNSPCSAQMPVTCVVSALAYLEAALVDATPLARCAGFGALASVAGRHSDHAPVFEQLVMPLIVAIERVARRQSTLGHVEGSRSAIASARAYATEILGDRGITRRFWPQFPGLQSSVIDYIQACYTPVGPHRTR